MVRAEGLGLKFLVAFSLACLSGGIALMYILSTAYSYEFHLPSRFSVNSSEAYELGRELAKLFPHKHSGSADVEKAALWLAGKLQGWGYNVSIQKFSAILGEQVVLRNVVGVKRGLGGESLLILTNYDQAPTARESASDTTAAVGVVLALAHALADEPTNKSLVFAFVDGEEWGMLGAAYVADNYPGPSKPFAAVVPEDVDVGLPIGIRVDPVGQFKGYTPLWLRELVKACALSSGLSFSDPKGFEEYAERAVLISFTDQGPLLARDIPTVHLGLWGDRPELQSQVYHSPLDLFENITPQAVEKYAKVAECTIRYLDDMPRVYAEPMLYLKLSEGLVVHYPFLALPQLLFLLPLAFTAARAIGINRPCWREALGYSAVLAALALSYGLAKLLPFTGLMPYFELYPPPPRHPLLYTPNYAAMGLWSLVTAFILYITIRTISKLKIEPARGWATELTILLTLSFIALFFNPFAATLLFLPAAYLWPHIIPGISRPRALALLLSGGVIVYLLIVIYAQRIYLSPLLMLWYLFMGVAYGLFTPQSMALFIAIITCGIRLFSLAWLAHKGKTSA